MGTFRFKEKGTAAIVTTVTVPLSIVSLAAFSFGYQYEGFGIMFLAVFLVFTLVSDSEE